MSDSSTPWYEASFGAEYLELYAHRNEAEAHADVTAIINLIAPSPDRPLLDLCCGAGRHLASLLKLGFSALVGLDLSAELLQIARQRLPSDGRVALVRADMRAIPFRNRFTTVLSLFTSFGYFAQEAENQAVLCAVFRALEPKGVFLLDYMNCEWVIDHLVEQEQRTFPDRQLDIVRCLSEDCRRVEKRVVVTTADGRQRTFFESVRMYSAAEMIDMVRAAGFVNIWTYGSLRGECLTRDSARLIIVARKGVA